MKVNSGNDIPAIHVYYSSMLNNSSFFNHLLYGIEEEGIPFELQEKQVHPALELGYQAALDSQLGVGIGIGNDGQMILHYTKLKKDEPLFQIEQENTYKHGVLGANAARLVKGIPFKSFEEIKAEATITVPKELPQKETVQAASMAVQEETLSKEEIAEVVAIVVKILKRLNS